MTTNLIEAAQRALEALNCHAGNYKLTKSECKELNRVTDDLTAAIEAAKKPVAEFKVSPLGKFLHLDWDERYQASEGDKLYLAPPAQLVAAELDSALNVFDIGLGFALCHSDFSSTREAIKKLQVDFVAIRKLLAAAPEAQT